ncbi:hypothetical protein CPB84DRAFT_1774592 [Gymnopilus junonius]|uniref:N-acetyltransferase domain-containing protein n=1 Tax=Gymnopilus junonius TaxID=109634 RepID=A0A9P5NNL6_GYMJU|nr:hypothetical protein CPB84DRAFT_1774592 [Gymnopilus junonius]
MSSSTPRARVITIRSRSLRARIILRSPKYSDVPSLTRRGNDPLCTLYVPFLRSLQGKITNESNQKQVQKWRAESGTKAFFLVVVLLPEKADDASEEATIGDTGLTPLDFVNKTAECGIMLNSGPSIRGKGYAVESLDLNFAYGFDHLGLETMYFGTLDENAPMRGLFEKKLGLSGEWREEEKDWKYVATKDWWLERQKAAGQERVVVDVEETLLSEEAETPS